ncbi:MAG: hypothetical protein ACYSUC_05475 [Planctomycetota bacterium]
MPAPITTEQHKAGSANQIIGLMSSKELQKARAMPMTKTATIPNRRAVTSINSPIKSGAIGM